MNVAEKFFLENLSYFYFPTFQITDYPVLQESYLKTESYLQFNILVKEMSDFERVTFKMFLDKATNLVEKYLNKTIMKVGFCTPVYG